MAAITWADVTAIAPELTDASEAVRVLVLAYVNDSVNAAALDGEEGSKTKMARVHLAAHVATVMRRSNKGQAGDVQSEALGPQSRSYGAQETELGPEDLGATGYGRTYRMVVRWSSARGPHVL